MINLRNFYYKKYFDKVNFQFLLRTEDTITKDNEKKISDQNKILCNNGYNQEDLEKANPRISPDIQNIRLKIAYPGLVTGIGIGHEASIKGEFKLGMHFHTTNGLPIIYGSSVKGVLRAYFKEVYPQNNNSLPSVKEAISDIFEGKIGDESKSIYKRDVFFDAVLVAPDSQGCILSKDSITPHKELLKDPIPITFMKIAPGCTLEFRFKLVESNINGKKITIDQKLNFFKEILTTFGIGAKSNVGYGQLE